MTTDQPNAAASTPAPTGQGQAQPATGTFQVPEKQRLVADADWQRTQERLRGQHDYVERGRKYGFEKPDDFEKYGKFSSTLKSKGLTLDQLMQAFADSPADGAQAASEQGFSPAQIDKYLSEKGYMTKEVFEKERAFDRAEFEHTTAQRQQDELFKAQLAAFLGKDTPEHERELWESYAEKALWDARTKQEMFYPKEHPLAEKYTVKPLQETGIKSVFEALAKKRDLARGAKLAALGQPAKPGSSTPAGSSATAPSTLPKAPSKDARPGGKPSVADVEAAYEKKKAMRGGGTVSSLGG